MSDYKATTTTLLVLFVSLILGVITVISWYVLTFIFKAIFVGIFVLGCGYLFHKLSKK